MDAFSHDVSVLAAKPPFPDLKSVVYEGKTNELAFSFAYPPPHNRICVRLSKEYVDFYPNGEVSLMVGDQFHIIPVSKADVSTLAYRIRELIEMQAQRGDVPTTMHTPDPPATAEEVDGGMGAVSSSWVVEPTLEFLQDESGHYHGLSAALLNDLSKAGNGDVILQDQPALGIATVTALLSIKDVLSKTTCDAWNVVRNEPVQIRFTFQRALYLDAPVKVEVGQAFHLRTRVFSGLTGQLRLIMEGFVERVQQERKGKAVTVSPLQQLLDMGVEEAAATAALKKSNGDLNGACRILTKGTKEDLQGPLRPLSSELSVAEKKSLPPEGTTGFFGRAMRYALQRIPSLPEFCVVCDQPHLFGIGNMMQSSCCSRPLCVFRFQQLDVGKDITRSLAMQDGVVDLLVSIARAAASSQRWDAIFNPFPHVFSASAVGPGEASLDPQKKDIDLARQVMSCIPDMRTVASSTNPGQIRETLTRSHPLAYPLFNWIVSSSKSYLVKIPEALNIPFMKTKLQFVLVTGSPESYAKFSEAKARHGTEWAFHGSRAENWHSIMRNGLKNASNTPLQLNGTAYGSGIYLSPHASVSFNYSQMSNQDGKGYDNSDYIDTSGMHCLAICEVVKLDIKKHGNIWVQPHEECVVTRFLFVYSGPSSSAGNVNLEEAGNADILNERVRVFTAS